MGLLTVYNGLLTSSRMGMTSKRQSKAVLLSAAILSTLYIENIQSFTGNQTNKQNIRMENYIYNKTNYQLFTGKWLEFRESSRAFFNLWHGNYIFIPIIGMEYMETQFVSSGVFFKRANCQ